MYFYMKPIRTICQQSRPFEALFMSVPDYSRLGRGHETQHQDDSTTNKPYPSFRFNISLTNFGLALPLVSFMIWPTKNPNNLVLPF